MNQELFCAVKMSQLPPPNFGNIPTAFNPAFNNMNGFAGMMGPAPSSFGRPPNPSLGFPPRLPMNSYPSYPGSHFMPGIWPNGNSLRPQFHHHVAYPPDGNNHSSQQQRPQVTNVQGQTTEYSCDACQKEFSSKETLNAHLGAHVQCTYEGCTFKAGRKILKLHWIQTHETGKMRIKLNTPEEIAKWREERKRKYPSIANVERKMEEEAKRKASGDVLKTKNFRYRRGQRGGRFQRGGHNHFNNRSHTRKGPMGPDDRGSAKVQRTEHSKDGNQARTSDDSKRLENGEDPLSLVLDGCDEDDETDDKTQERLSTQKELCSTRTPNEEPCNAMPDTSALSSLCSAYASDSEVEEEPSEINNNKHTNCSPNEKDTNEPEAGMAVKSTSELRHEMKHDTGSRSKRPRRRSRKNTSKANSKSTGIQKSTLLEKLLAPEVRHERNAILQCLRHIVKRNFFGAGDTNLSENNVKNENCDEFVNKSS